ncbi:hypothetical protein KAI92_02995 [Candidatus Parcubacteria bacterium]|nr:hypothetical protein [Candidatus Parcubacteria bacterium]
MNNLGLVESEFCGIPIKLFPAFGFGVFSESLQFNFKQKLLADNFACYFLINKNSKDFFVGCIVKRLDAKKFLELTSGPDIISLYKEIKEKVDFDLMKKQKCQVCGNNEVLVNSDIYNIDSVVCVKCHNRPFLNLSISSRIISLHKQCVANRRIADEEFFSLVDVLIKFKHSLKNFGSSENINMMRNILSHTMIGQAVGDNPERIRFLSELLEFDFEIYKRACLKLVNFLCGEDSYNQENLVFFRHVFKTMQYINEKDSVLVEY